MNNLFAFSSALALVGGALLSGVLGYVLLPRLRRLHVGQQVRSDGPQSHLSKTGTPTFGGFFFLIPLLLAGVVLALAFPSTAADSTALALAIAGFGAIGFADDYVKVRITKEGLSVRQKTVTMLALSVLVTAYILFGRGDPVIYFFWAPYVVSVTGWWKLLYGIFLVIYLYFCINAVNLTDGVDGLAASVTFCVGFVPLLASAFFPVPGWLTLYNLVTSGGCFGFWLHNRHPAKVFMGDTGSLALGAVVALTPVWMGVPWLFALFGLVYVLEALSVVIQVSYFKATHGKRIFRMSPIHHHFELGGWTENQIVLRFSLFACVAIALGLALLYACLPA